MSKLAKTVFKHGKEQLNPFSKKAWHPMERLKMHKRQYAEFTSTTAGKVVFAAIAAYLTWGFSGGFSGAAGAGGGTAGAGGTAAEGMIGGGTAAGTTAGTTAGEIAAGMGAEAAAIDAGLTAAQVTQAGSTASQAVAGAGASSGFGSAAKGMIGKVGGYIAKNPEIAASVLSGISNMAAPDEIDMMREQEKMLERQRQERYRNLDTRGIDIGFSPSGTPLRDRFGSRLHSTSGGLIGNRLRAGLENYQARSRFGGRIAEENRLDIEGRRALM